MAAATVNARSIMSIGPAKMEFISVTASNTNTVSSYLNTVNFAIPFPGAATAAGCSCAVSGREITVHDPGVAQPVIILAFGS